MSFASEAAARMPKDLSIWGLREPSWNQHLFASLEMSASRARSAKLRPSAAGVTVVVVVDDDDDADDDVAVEPLMLVVLLTLLQRLSFLLFLLSGVVEEKVFIPCTVPISAKVSKRRRWKSRFKMGRDEFSFSSPVTRCIFARRSATLSSSENSSKRAEVSLFFSSQARCSWIVSQP